MPALVLREYMLMLAKILMSIAALLWLVVPVYSYREYRLLSTMRFLELRNFRKKWEWRVDIAVLMVFLFGSLAIICVIWES